MLLKIIQSQKTINFDFKSRPKNFSIPTFKNRVDEFDYTKPLEGQKKSAEHWRNHSIIYQDVGSGKVCAF
jgi:hypothetical protein